MAQKKDRLWIRLGQWFEGAAEGPYGIVALVVVFALLGFGLRFW